MKVGSLFSGIGGLDLGLEQAGMQTVWQVEYDDWARQKLDENFPHTKKYKDVREVGKHNLEPVDLICGGFPCQDVSTVGARVGIDGERSGLWQEMFRIICELRPRYVLVENVTGLLHRGFSRVLGDLASIRYDAEWSVLSACSLGASHSRERLFLLAYPNTQRFQASGLLGNGNDAAIFERGKGYCEHLYPTAIPAGSEERQAFTGEPAMDRVADGIPDRVASLQALGNAVCPPVAKWIGERIIEFDSRT